MAHLGQSCDSLLTHGLSPCSCNTFPAGHPWLSKPIASISKPMCRQANMYMHRWKSHLWCTIWGLQCRRMRAAWQSCLSLSVKMTLSLSDTHSAARNSDRSMYAICTHADACLAYHVLGK